MQNLIAVLTLSVALAPVASSAVPCELSDSDRIEIKSVIEKYRTSWLKDDAKGVQDTFTEDAALLPHHGDKPVVGKPAIIAYWWPSGASPAGIDRLEITSEAIDGDCNVAYVRGHDSVWW